MRRNLPPTSIFGTLDAASGFFERGSLGYSTATVANRLDGLELRTKGWKVQPLAVDRVESSVFDNVSKFPRGSIAFDCALLMRGIEHEWHTRQPLCYC